VNLRKKPLMDIRGWEGKPRNRLLTVENKLRVAAWGSRWRDGLNG